MLEGANTAHEIKESLRTSEYLLLFRGAGWQSGLSPQELQTLMVQRVSWTPALALGTHSEVRGRNTLVLTEEDGKTTMT